MNIRLGIYEVFSRIIPGCLYMVAVAHFLSIVGLINFNLGLINDLSFAATVGLVVVAYILGGAFDIFSLALFKLFRKSGFSNEVLVHFKEKYKTHWQIDFRDEDQPILFAFIRTKNLELAGELDRHNALSIMLRNVSLGLLLIAINWLIQFLILKNSVYIFMFVFMLGVSMLILRESIKFRSYFYNGVYETILAYRIDLEAAIKPIRPGEKRSRVKRDE